MPFERPALSELIEAASADIDGRLPGADSRLRRSVLGVLARTHAGAMHGAYGFLDWIARQVLPDTAEAEQLDRHGAIWGVTRKPPEPARGSVMAAGSNGSVIPAGAVLQRSDGAAFTVLAEETVTGGAAVLEVEAALGGSLGLTPPGLTLVFASPVAGVAAAVTVAVPGLVGGADEEADEAYRARILARIREQPRGGSQSDYERWALEVPGVTRAWVYPEMNGLGTVGVTFVMDGREDIIPEPADVAAVEAWIAPRRPVTADVDVFAPEPVDLDLTIDLTPDTAGVRAAVIASLRDLLARDAEPGGTILISRIREAVSIAAGEADHVLTLPSANVTHDAGELAVLGDITWT